MTVSLNPTLSPVSYNANLIGEGTISTDANGDVEFSALLDGGSVAVVGISGQPVTQPTETIGVMMFDFSGGAQPQGNPTPSSIMAAGDAMFTAFRAGIDGTGHGNANFLDGMTALENSFNMLETEGQNLSMIA